MAHRVYIETTIPSYLTAWPSRDVVRAANQQLTRQWWETRRADFDLVVSQLVLDECAAGDSDAAKARLAELQKVPVLAATEPVTLLAAKIASGLSLPPKAVNDAIHIATAAVHAVEYLLTCNCAHIANAAFRGRIEASCAAAGFRAPVIATPEQLLKGASDVGGRGFGGSQGGAGSACRPIRFRYSRDRGRPSEARGHERPSSGIARKFSGRRGSHARPTAAPDIPQGRAAGWLTRSAAVAGSPRISGSCFRNFWLHPRTRGSRTCAVSSKRSVSS